MPISRPYYRIHQIIAGQYAVLGEFVTADGEDYEGAYHVLPNNKVFSEYQPSDKSVQIFYKRSDINQLSKYYNKVKGINQLVSNYTAPKYHTCVPTQQDYADGYLYRYFAQKRNSPLDTIIEISYQDFTTANLTNSPGISLQLYNTTSIKWLISRVSKKEAAQLNSKLVAEVNRSFLGISTYLSDFTEFYQ